MNKVDTLSLSMYFGLFCNGACALAPVWNEVNKRENDVKKYLSDRKGQPPRLFKLLVHVDKSLQSGGDKQGKCGLLQPPSISISRLCC